MLRDGCHLLPFCANPSQLQPLCLVPMDRFLEMGSIDNCILNNVFVLSLLVDVEDSIHKIKCGIVSELVKIDCHLISSSRPVEQVPGKLIST